jgi:hypothetical protein
VPGESAEDVSLLAVWCIVPAVWGLWAMVAPAAWVPRRLPPWGAILGLLAGTVVMFGLNLPLRMFGVAASVTQRGLAVLAFGGLYYLFWRVVRVVFEALTRSPRTAPVQGP